MLNFPRSPVPLSTFVALISVFFVLLVTPAGAVAQQTKPAGAPAPAATAPVPAKPATAQPAPSTAQQPAKPPAATATKPSATAAIAEPETAAEEADRTGGEDESVEEAAPEEPRVSRSSRRKPPSLDHAPAPGNAIKRQMSSVQRQLGNTGGGGGGFFLSSWTSESPEASVAAASALSNTEAPEDCGPLDKTIADAYIRDSATREGVSPDLVREVVRRESGFNPCAVSPKGAIGMMQLMPETAESLGVTDPFDPRQNIDGGVRHLKRLVEKYKGRPDLALAAYNAGEAAVDANQSVPAYQETREYVSTIMKRVFEEKNTTATPSGIEPITPIKIPRKAIAPPSANQAPGTPPALTPQGVQ